LLFRHSTNLQLYVHPGNISQRFRYSTQQCSAIAFAIRSFNRSFLNHRLLKFDFSPVHPIFPSGYQARTCTSIFLSSFFHSYSSKLLRIVVHLRSFSSFFSDFFQSLSPRLISILFQYIEKGIKNKRRFLFTEKTDVSTYCSLTRLTIDT
jgi:hypothetical protein